MSGNIKITAAEALERIQNGSGVADFFKALNDIDMGTSSGSTTVLYTGNFAGQTTPTGKLLEGDDFGDTGAFRYVQDLHKDRESKINWLDRGSNQAAMFLNEFGDENTSESIALKGLLEKEAYIQDKLKAIYEAVPESEHSEYKKAILDEEMTKLFRGEGPAHLYPDGKPEGAWDIGSRNLVNASEGNIMVITQDVDKGKVFYQTELEAIMKNDKITHINSVEKSFFLKTWNRSDLSLEQKKDIITNQVIEAVPHQMDINKKFVAGEIDSFLDEKKLSIDSGSSSSSGQAEILSRKITFDIDEEFVKHASDTAKKLGTAGDILEITTLSTEVYALLEQGKNKEAADLVAKFAVEAAGGGVGGVAAGMLAATAIGAIGITGAPVIFIAAGASLLGSVVGGETAGEAYDRLSLAFDEMASGYNLDINDSGTVKVFDVNNQNNFISFNFSTGQLVVDGEVIIGDINEIMMSSLNIVRDLGANIVGTVFKVEEGNIIRVSGNNVTCFCSWNADFCCWWL